MTDWVYALQGVTKAEWVSMGAFLKAIDDVDAALRLYSAAGASVSKGLSPLLLALPLLSLFLLHRVFVLLSFYFLSHQMTSSARQWPLPMCS